MTAKGSKDACHPDLESLDAYADGDRRDLAVDRHVHDCHDCAEAVAALRQVRSDLARLTSVTMPDDVAGRIRAALAAERAAGHNRSAARSSGAADARLIGPGGGGPSPRSRLRTGVGGGWHPQHVGSLRDWLVAAACLAVVVAVAVGVVSIDSSPDATTASLAAGSTPEGTPQAETEDAAGRGYAADGYAASGSVGSAAPTQVAVPPAALPATTVSASNAVLADSEFADHADDVLAERTDLRVTVRVPEFGESVFHGAAGIPADAWAVLTSPVAALCYHGLATRTGGGVLAVDQVYYRGDPALFVVLSTPNSPSSVVAVVVGAGCAIDSGSPSLMRSVTVDRP